MFTVLPGVPPGYVPPVYEKPAPMMPLSTRAPPLTPELCT